MPSAASDEKEWSASVESVIEDFPQWVGELLSLVQPRPGLGVEEGCREGWGFPSSSEEFSSSVEGKSGSAESSTKTGYITRFGNISHDLLLQTHPLPRSPGEMVGSVLDEQKGGGGGGEGGGEGGERGAGAKGRGEQRRTERRHVHRQGKGAQDKGGDAAEGEECPAGEGGQHRTGEGVWGVNEGCALIYSLHSPPPCLHLLRRGGRGRALSGYAPTCEKPARMVEIKASKCRGRQCYKRVGSVSVTTFWFVCTHLPSDEKEGNQLYRNGDLAEILKRTRFPCRSTHHPTLSQTILSHNGQQGALAVDPQKILENFTAE
eukprot:Gb_07664 [translate_table: standard]